MRVVPFHFLKKPRLVRVRDSMDFSHLRPLLEGFVIKVPKAVAESSEFDRLHRRLVCCGAFVTGDNLRQTDKTITHVIVNSEAHPTSPVCQFNLNYFATVFIKVTRDYIFRLVTRSP